MTTTLHTESRLYGISTGNGNDGLSRMFAGYYVRTTDPWRLAELAAISQFKTSGFAWAKRNVDIDGDAEFGISAVFLAPPCEDTPDGEYPELPEGVDYEDAEDGRNWSDANGAWMIVEVFPDSEPRDGAPVYESIDDAFDDVALAAVPENEKSAA